MASNEDRFFMSAYTDFDDNELLQRMMSGDEEAFTTLYRRRQGGLYRFALQISGSEAVAEDVTQEVFFVLMRKASEYVPARGSLKAYLYGIARNHVLRYLEGKRASISMVDGLEEYGSRVPEPLIVRNDPLGDLTRHERIESVRRAVLALPARYREVVVLCDLHEMEYGEASAVVGCRVGTIRSRLHRGRALLAERLSDAKPFGPALHRIKPKRCFA